jgi:hypothetical protein
VRMPGRPNANYLSLGTAGVADFFAGFAGRLLPNEPLNIFPFFVFLSPLPIIITLNKNFIISGAVRRVVKNMPGGNRRGSKIRKLRNQALGGPKARKFPIPGRGALFIMWCTTTNAHSTNYNFADNSFPALNFATFFALILITAPV